MVSTVVLVIIMLNFLIAIVSATFERVSENKKNATNYDLSI